MSGGPLRLNLGSGNEPLPGYVNVDQRAVPGVDVVADVTELPFPDDSADEVLASSLLEHFEDPYSVLDEIHRVLGAEGSFVMRVPTPWSYSGQLDRSHAFLADLKLWREILAGYFESVGVRPEGVRYRDNKLLVALSYVLIHGLRMFELAQTWRFHCGRKRSSPWRAYIPWWLEEKYGVQQPAGTRGAATGDRI
jgi:SAM-dependent methyltransferase